MMKQRRLILILLTFILLLSSFAFIYASDVDVDKEIHDNTDPENRPETVEEAVYYK